MMTGAATTPIGGHRFAGHLTRQPVHVWFVTGGDSSAVARHAISAWAATWIARVTVVTAPGRLFGSRPWSDKPWLA